MCLTDEQMSEHATHIEMDADRMGNHVNLKGVAVFQVTFDENGGVVDARAISGNPLAIGHLIDAAKRWRFEPYVRDGIARKGCGRITLNFSMVEGVRSVQVQRSR
jgi:hypothetical protein